MRELHVWENPLLHGGLPTGPSREVVYKEHEYDWWNFSERGDLIIGVTEPTAVDEFGNALSYANRTVWLIARGMYAKVWENILADEPAPEEGPAPYSVVTDEDRFEVPTFTETIGATGVYFSHNARGDDEGAKIFELPPLPEMPLLDLDPRPEPPRQRFAGNTTLYWPRPERPPTTEEVPPLELPAPEPEPPPEPESKQKPVGFLLNPTLNLPLVSSEQE